MDNTNNFIIKEFNMNNGANNSINNNDINDNNNTDIYNNNNDNSINSLDLEKIQLSNNINKKDNNNKNCIFNNNDGSCEDCNNDVLFFRIWRNVYLNKLIFHHINLYHYCYIYFKHTFKSLKEFEFRGYLTRLIILQSIEEDGLGDTPVPMPKNIIPKCVVSLVFLKNVTIIEGDIPPSVIFLSFNKKFKYFPLGQIIPDTVRKLRIGPKVYIDNDCVLPRFLEYLYISKKDQCELLKKNVPKTLERLSVCDITPSFKVPNTIKYISFCGDFNKKIPSLPPNLETIKIGNHFKKEIPTLPKSILTIIIGKSKKFSHITHFSKMYPNLKYLDCFIQDLVFPKKIMNRVVDFELKNSQY